MAGLGMRGVGQETILRSRYFEWASEEERPILEVVDFRQRLTAAGLEERGGKVRGVRLKTRQELESAVRGVVYAGSISPGVVDLEAR